MLLRNSEALFTGDWATHDDRCSELKAACSLPPGGLSGWPLSQVPCPCQAQPEVAVAPNP